MNVPICEPSADPAMMCWICGSHSFVQIRESKLSKTVNSSDFRITDAGYGITASVFRCLQCSFNQCGDLGEVLSFYEGMSDPGYEQTRDARLFQARKLVNQIKKYCSSGRFLDVGAGSGILVEEAIKSGFQVKGIEPSAWLTDRAKARGLPVHHGTLPNPDIVPGFDVVTLIDVIEHVTNPMGLLREMRDAMADNGIAVIVTPDVRSWAARVLGWNWWHYRIAHISYFSRATLSLALKRAGLTPLSWSRPTWYLPGDYVATRLASYLPRGLRPQAPKVLRRVTVPLNLFDSWLVVARKDKP